MLFGICGNLGIGKTLMLTYLGLKEYLNGNSIYANYHLFNMKYKLVEEPRDFINVIDGIFLGDELWLWADSRLSQTSKNKFVTKVLARSRHVKTDIAYTVQHRKQIDARIRRITDVWFFPKLVNPTKVLVDYMDVRNYTDGVFSFNPFAIYQCYDHHEQLKEIDLDYED